LSIVEVAACQGAAVTRATLYPAFRGERGAIEATTEKGLVVELTVRCQNGTGIMTYSKIENLSGGPKLNCPWSRKRAIERLCR
jgi:hypothetical protein